MGLGQRGEAGGGFGAGRPQGVSVEGGGAARGGPGVEGHQAGVAQHHGDHLRLHAERLGDDQGQPVLGALPHLRRAGESRHPAVGADLDPGRGGGGGRVGLHAEGHPAAAAGRLGARPPRGVGDPAEQGPPVAVDRRVVGHDLVAPAADVAEAQGHRVHPQTMGGGIHLPLDRHVDVGSPEAAERGGGRRGGEQAAALRAGVRRPVEADGVEGGLGDDGGADVGVRPHQVVTVDVLEDDVAVAGEARCGCGSPMPRAGRSGRTPRRRGPP